MTSFREIKDRSIAPDHYLGYCPAIFKSGMRSLEIWPSANKNTADDIFYFLIMKWTMRRRPYESEFEQFINELKRQHPDIEDRQREAHAMWWDRPPLQLEEMQRDRMSEVRPKPYAYS